MTYVDSNVIGCQPLDLNGNVFSAKTVMVNALRSNLLDNAITVTVTEVNAAHQGVREWAGESAVVFLSAKIAVDRFDSAFEDIGWLFVEDVDRATNSVTTVQCALRATQYLNSFDIPEGCRRRGQQVFGVDAVHISSNTRVATQCAEVSANTTNGGVIRLNRRRRHKIL